MKPILPYEPYLVPIASKLRKSLTYSERIMWNILKGKAMMGYDFHRQSPILNYIVDFFSIDLMLAIEVDGITHFDDGKDAFARQAELESLGIQFLRIDALELRLRTSEVIQKIEKWIEGYEEKHGVGEEVLERRRK